jgi:galactokinase
LKLRSDSDPDYYRYKLIYINYKNRKQQWNQTTIALTNDVQVLAKECTSLRNFMSQQMSSCSSKMDELKETFDRQLTMGFTHWRQKLDTCQKQWISFERVTKESIQKLYQNHSQIRFALNENMKINTNEVKNLSKELNNLKEVQQIKMDQWFDQFTTHSIECTKTKDRLQRHLQIIAHALELSIK